MMTIFRYAWIAAGIVVVHSAVSDGQSVTRLNSQSFAALQSGGLPAVARLVEHYVGVVEDTQGPVADDLRGLLVGTDAIVLGRLNSRLTSQLSGDQQSINTDYDFVINEVYYGAVVPSQHIRVRLWGGMVRFDDGTTAELLITRTPQFTLATDYLMFLEMVDASSSVYRPAGGPQAVFGFDSSARTVSFARHTDIVFKYNGLARTDFVNQVQGIVH